MDETTRKTRGVVVEVHHSGLFWRATVGHRVEGGATYERFNGAWSAVVEGDIPRPAYRALRAELRRVLTRHPGRA